MQLVETLDNGLVVIIDEMPHVASASYELAIPGGVISDPSDLIGNSLILSEMTTRGAGDFDSKELSDAFDSLGVRHHDFASDDRFSYRGSLLAQRLGVALNLTSLMVCYPRFPEIEIESVRSGYLQELTALRDDPARRALTALAERYYPAPFNRPSVGTEEGIRKVTIDSLKESWRRNYHPNGSVLSIAGAVTAKDTIELVSRTFEEWKGEAPSRPDFGTFPEHSAHHISEESAQLQLGMSIPSVPYGDPDYYIAKVIAGVLSGGGFGRLFVEVREKRGLCYSVFARHVGARDFGTMIVYAGTTPERASETLAVVKDVLMSLSSPIDISELERAKANLKASLVLSEESSGSRAVSNASDYLLGGRVRSIQEVVDEINKVNEKSIHSYLERYPFDSYMMITLGAQELS